MNKILFILILFFIGCKTKPEIQKKKKVLEEKPTEVLVKSWQPDAIRNINDAKKLINKAKSIKADGYMRHEYNIAMNLLNESKPFMRKKGWSNASKKARESKSIFDMIYIETLPKKNEAEKNYEVIQESIKHLELYIPFHYRFDNKIGSKINDADYSFYESGKYLNQGRYDLACQKINDAKKAINDSLRLSCLLTEKINEKKKSLAEKKIELLKKDSDTDLNKINNWFEQHNYDAILNHAKVPVKRTSYVVKKNDYLWSISKKVYGDATKWRLIYTANNKKIKNPNKIYPGQLLIIRGK